MIVFYDPRQSVTANSSFSPSAQKPAQVVKSWKQLGIPYEVRTFAPLTAEEIALAHDPIYVADVLACKRANGFNNKNPEVPWHCRGFAVVWSQVLCIVYKREKRHSRPRRVPTTPDLLMGAASVLSIF